jgi:CBS-domain-containing membrane protein
LVLFPIAIVLILLGVEILTRHHILFTSLVSSIFLIYVNPEDPMNDTLTILVSQILATGVGYTSYLLLGDSYWAGCVTVISVTFILVGIDKLHPPAIATSLIFNYRTHSQSDLVLFGLLIGLIAILFLMKKGYSYLEQLFFEKNHKQ